MSESIEVGSKVELLPGRDEVYKQAVAGSRGVIRHTKLDKHGYPMVFVEWDKDHWKYNGEPDGWTFESHFKVISPPSQDEELSLARQVIEDAQARRDQEKCSSCGTEHDDALALADHFLTTLYSAFEEAQHGDGFVMVTVRATPDGKSTIYRPMMFSAVLHDSIIGILEGQIASLAASALKDFAQERLKDDE